MGFYDEQAGLEKLVQDAIISAEEKEKLYDALRNIERYMVERSHQINEEVQNVGDEDYISISERDKAEGRAEGRAEGKAEERAEMIRNLLESGMAPEEVASRTKVDLKIVLEVQNSVFVQ